MKQKIDLPHLAGRLLGTPLMIQQKKLEAIVDVWERKLQGLSIEAPLTAQERERRDYEVTAEGIALVPVIGTLVQRGVTIGAWSGLTSYQYIEDQLNLALRDDYVKAILLDIDSPGGEVAGCFDLVDKIFAARQQKPVWAFANELSASAAYAIGSAAEKVYVTRTAFVGSVGVVTAHVDVSGKDAQEGRKYTYIYAGEAKVDGNPHEPLSERALASIQAEIDSIYDLFVATVARNRGLKDDAVRATQARVFMGADAVKAGMADGISTLEELYGALVARAGTNSPAFLTRTKEMTMSDNTNPTPEDDKTPAAPAQAPAPAAPEEKEEKEGDEKEGVAEAVLAERKRCKAITETATKLGVPYAVYSEMIAAGMTIGKAKNKLIDYAHENAPSAGISGANPSATREGGDADAALPIEEQAKKEWERNASLHKEFRSLNTYTAWRKAESDGRARIFKKNQ